MHLYNKLLTVALLFLITGCASRADLDALQRDLDELKSRSVQLQKEVGGVKTEAKESVETSVKGFEKDLESIRKGTADLQATLDATTTSMQALSGDLDNIKRNIQKPADDVALLKEDSERRMTAIEERLLKLEKNFDELMKKAVEAKKEAELNPDMLYQKGIDTFKAGNLPKARETFDKFIELYPNHELAANAHYWLGETYYSEKTYDRAILEFEQVIKNFPTKSKVPAALLKQGMAFKALGDVKSARYVLKKLVEEYPLADEAKLAKERLKELK